MIHNLKTLGLALAAVFALNGVGASAASAQQGKLTSDGPVTLDASAIPGKVNTFTAFGGEFNCLSFATLTGHKTLTTAETEAGKKHEPIPSGSTSVTITPDFVQKNCKYIEGGTTVFSMTLTMNGCDFDLHIGATIGAGPSYGLTTDVVCPTGKSIEEEIYSFAGSELGGVACTFKVKSQTGIAGATAKTNAASDDIEIEGAFTGMTTSRSGFGCSPEETTVGVIHVNLTVQGTSAIGGATGVTLSD